MRPYLICLALAVAAWAQPAKPQLVQSVPEGTPLADPSLPFAKEAWPQMIRGAQRSIDLAEFYVTNRAGSFLEPVIRELELAGARGVKVRTLLSTRMLGQDPASVERLRAIPGAELRNFDFGQGVRGILHAKYFIVDGEEAFLGSQNFDWRALQHIHEMGLRFRSPELVQPLARIFGIDWEFAKTKVIPTFPTMPPGKPPGVLELVASPPHLLPPGVRPALPALLRTLDSAKERIRVQLLTYSPVSGKSRFWPTLDNALRSAAVRGTKVQLMVSDWNTEKPAVDHLKSLSLLPNVEVKIVSIPDDPGGPIPYARVIHSKYMTVDGKLLWLGTSNWAEDYFTESRNVELILKDSDLTAQADRVFERLWNGPFAAAIEPGRNYVPRKRD
ncbi:MAG: phospholipase [Acidobacteria bacterium]|nr:phospholipase [Acidobacteriota bacterium]